MRQPKVLIVEDNAATRALIEDTLELEGFDTASVATGTLALKALEGNPLPSLVILDVMLPGADGFEVLSHIRASEQTKQLPVLMLTAMADASSTWKGWAGGCDYYMNKPFDTDDLMTAVRRLVQWKVA
jgi:DNA-binding response OmpR family regulator